MARAYVEEVHFAKLPVGSMQPMAAMRQADRKLLQVLSAYWPSPPSGFASSNGCNVERELSNVRNKRRYPKSASGSDATTRLKVVLPGSRHLECVGTLT
jgi:hypothetical protein